MRSKFFLCVEVAPACTASKLVCPWACFTAADWMIRIVSESAIHRVGSRAHSKLWPRGSELLSGRVLSCLVRCLQSFDVRVGASHLFIAGISVLLTGGLVGIRKVSLWKMRFIRFHYDIWETIPAKTALRLLGYTCCYYWISNGNC